MLTLNVFIFLNDRIIVIELNKLRNIVMKKIEKRDASNDFRENFTSKLSLNDKLTLTIKRREIFEKKKYNCVKLLSR